MKVVVLVVKFADGGSLTRVRGFGYNKIFGFAIEEANEISLIWIQLRKKCRVFVCLSVCSNLLKFFFLKIGKLAK